MLPPIPDDVLHCALTFDVDGRDYECGFWLLVPDLAGGGLPYLDTVSSDLFFYLLPGTTGITHAGASLATCRLTPGGIGFAPLTAYAPPNHGAHTGGQAAAIASGIYIASSSSRRGSGSRVRFPGCPDDFIDSGWRLSPAGVSGLLAMCNALVSFVAATTGPTGAPAVLGTLQRRTAGGPLGTSTFDPASSVRPSFRVDHLGRRLPRTGRVSPL